jgi:hypothetical protein
LGWLDRWRGLLRSSATQAAGAYAAKKAVEKAKGAAASLGEDFLTFAEGELEAAEGERDAREDVVERVRADAESERENRREARIEREARARRELAALKEAYAQERESD